MLLIRPDPPAEVTRSSALFYSNCTWSLAGFKVNCRFFSPFSLFSMEILLSEASLSGMQLRSGFGVWMNMLVLFPFFYSQQWSLTNGIMGVLIFLFSQVFYFFQILLNKDQFAGQGWERPKMMSLYGGSQRWRPSGSLGQVWGVGIRGDVTQGWGLQHHRSSCWACVYRMGIINERPECCRGKQRGMFGGLRKRFVYSWYFKHDVCVCSVVSDSLRPNELYPVSLLCLWNFPGKNTGVSCHFLLQGIFPTQDWTRDSCVSHIGRWILCHCTTFKLDSGTLMNGKNNGS